MPINTNVNPYYDDFDESKNFYQILFKPGYAVQSRELTQIQSILRGQIEKFGNHIFKHGSVVIPGNAFADLSTPYIKLDSSFNGSAIQPSLFEGNIIVGGTTGIRALVKKAIPATTTDPVTFYVSYITGGGTDYGNQFLAAETVYLESAPTTQASIVGTNHSGIGSLAFINTGVFYIHGTFVHIDAQSTVLSKYDGVPSVHVLLKITESIVTDVEDSTLLDPAQGSYNYSAPGADRIKISLTLTTLPLGSAISDDYVEIMRYNQGELEEHAKYPSYSELEKSLARRTFDESGDYLVNGFGHTIRDHLRTQYNNGVYVDGDRDKFVVEVAPGKGYINGLETEVVGKKFLSIDKARTSDHVKEKKSTIQTSYGQYLYVTALKTLPNFSTRQVVNLYNDNDPTNGSATKIGEVRVVAIDYFSGDPASATAIYKLYIDQLTMNTGYTINNVGGIRFDSSGSMTVLQKFIVQNPTLDYTANEIINNTGSTRTATVLTYDRSAGNLFVYRHDHTKESPVSGDRITGATSTSVGTVQSIEAVGVVNNGSIPIFGLPSNAIKSLKNINTNLYDISYTAWKRFTITTNGSGNGTFTTTDGVFISPESGNIVAASSTGIVTVDKFSLAGGGTQLVLTGGPLSATVYILAQTTKTAIQPRVKTLTTQTLTGVSPATIISLGKADIYNVVSIVDASSNDVTDSYILNNGQTDYYYGLGHLELVGNLPSSNLTIVFQYFAHSGSGDYFSVDSYSTLGDDYIARAPTYISKSNSQRFDLAACLDFRPTIGSSGSFESGSPSLIDVPVIDTFCSTSVQYYVPRIDIIYLNKDRSVMVSRGVPANVPTRPKTPESSIQLCILFIPSYTISIADILSRSLNNYRYTMDDIRKIEDRVTNVEYFSTLNSLETSLVSYDVVDAATGLNRYKTGYLADNFENAFNVCDFMNIENRSSFFNKTLSAAAEDHLADFVFLVSSTNYSLTDEKQISLPYAETEFIKQDTATRVTNLNPFMVFSWEGTMTIEPSFDVWIETQDLPTIYKTVEKTVFIDAPRSTPAPAPASSGWSPPDPIPAPAPTSKVSALARDLGLVDPSLRGTPAWDAKVDFVVPQSVYNQTVAQINPKANDPAFYTNNDWVKSDAWTGSITALNTAYNSAISATSSNSSVYTNGFRSSTNQVINYWNSLV